MERLENTRDGKMANEIRKGHTLVSAAATVAALGVLAICFIPAAAGVRRSSKQSKCLANLMQIGYANAIYAAQDPADMAIPVHEGFFEQDRNHPIWIGPYEWGGKSGRGETGFVKGKPGDSVNSRYGTQAGFGPARRPLNRILYGDQFPDHTDDPGEGNANWLADAELDLGVHHCPSDSGYTGVHSPAFRDERLSSYDHFGTSYGANMFMVGSTGGGCMISNSPFLHRMSKIISPATTLAYQENNGRFAWAVQPEQCFFLQGVAGTVRGWHGKDWTFNASFIDGHADTIYMRGYRSVRIGRYPPSLRDCSTVPISESGTFDQYQCIIIRGDGWQKDTMPAAFIQTRINWSGNENDRPSYEGGIE